MNGDSKEELVLKMRQNITQIKQCAACETLNSFFSRNNSHWGLRIGLLLFIAGLQFGQFYLKFELYEIIPYNGYVNVEMSFDDYIPYLEWSWVIYYFGFAYIAIWGAAGIWRFSKRELYRTVTVYSLLIFMGLVLHLYLLLAIDIDINQQIRLKLIDIYRFTIMIQWMSLLTIFRKTVCLWVLIIYQKQEC